MAQQVTVGQPRPIPFLLVDEFDDESPIELIDPSTIVAQYRRSGDVAFNTFTNEPTEIGVGWYEVVPTPTEIGVLGNFLINAYAPGTDIWRDLWAVVRELVTGGSYPVNQDFLDGITLTPYNLSAYALEAGPTAYLDDARITAYLKADYDAGNVTDPYVKDRTLQRGDGKWTSLLMLDPANIYTLVYEAPRRDSIAQEITIP